MSLAPEVREAMASAGAACARVEDLQEAAGELIANVTGAEAGYVTAGAAAGLTMSAAAAAIAGLDLAAMDQLPDTTGLRNEIIVQRGHVTAYSHALRVSGAKLVDVGYVGYPGQGRTWPWQVEAAINDRTAAMFYSVGSAPGMVELPELVALAHPPQPAGHRRRRRNVAAGGKSPAVRRPGSRSRLLQRRQSDRRAAGVGHPCRTC